MIIIQKKKKRESELDIHICVDPVIHSLLKTY